MNHECVACLWSGASSVRGRITSSVVLKEHGILHTGMADGSIIRWHLSNDQSSQKIWPMAILCGHAAAVVGLEVCRPCSDSEPGKSNNGSSRKAGGSTALISICVDAVLCVWSSGSGRCKHRRRMPPWVGTPAAMSSLPASSQYVCIAGKCVDNSSSSATADPEVASVSQEDNKLDKETASYARMSKCSVIIVDSHTLNILQTVVQGNLSIEPVLFMFATIYWNQTQKQSVLIADAVGNVQLVIVGGTMLSDDQNDPLPEGDLESSLHKVPYTTANGLPDSGLEAISVSSDGKVMAVIFRTLCMFRLTMNGTIIGRISLKHAAFCREGLCNNQQYIIGGSFLRRDDTNDLHDVNLTTDGFTDRFALWSNRGAATIYVIQVYRGSFVFEPLCEIPAVAYSSDLEMSVEFCQLNNFLLRLESVCCSAESLLLWQLHASVWSLGDPFFKQLYPEEDLGKLRIRSHGSSGPYECIMLGKGGYPGNSILDSYPLSKTDPIKWAAKDCAENLFNSNGAICKEYTDVHKRKHSIISSSMVLSEKFHGPYAVVYGFFNGEIELVRFDSTVNRLNSGESENLCHGSGHLHTSEQYFSGHTGAVLCLAAHHIVAAESGQGRGKWLLVSGSMDCTIRIWDLDNRVLVSVMHHHSGPVRQIILAPKGAYHPWADCFLSVGEDSCVALTSLETLRVERMFPGHPGYPEMVVWDCARGYIACLCRHSSPMSHVFSDFGFNVLYIWDVKTGARERCLHGTASNLVFDQFCRSIIVNSDRQNVTVDSTSASPLSLPLAIEDAGSQHHVNFSKAEKGLKLSPIGKTTQVGAVGFTGTDVSVEYHATTSNIPTTQNLNTEKMNRPVHQLSSSLFFQKYGLNFFKCSCPIPGVAALIFNLFSLAYICQKEAENIPLVANTQIRTQKPDQIFDGQNVECATSSHPSDDVSAGILVDKCAWMKSPKGRALCFSLSFLHLWDIDHELDTLLTSEMGIHKPESFALGSGLIGDQGALTLILPGLQTSLELWRSSAEFCALQSLTMVSLAQCMINLSSSSSTASSALAAFYTRKFAEKVPDVKPPSLQVACNA